MSLPVSPLVGSGNVAILTTRGKIRRCFAIISTSRRGVISQDGTRRGVEDDFTLHPTACSSDTQTPQKGTLNLDPGKVLLLQLIHNLLKRGLRRCGLRCY